MESLFRTSLIIVIFHVANGYLFDRYTGKKVNATGVKELDAKNTTQLCIIKIKSCTPHEGSRIDGTCNNYKFPSRGAAKGPYLRMLKPKSYYSGVNAELLPSARKVRTTLQSTGRVEDKTMFNVAAVHFLQFINKDVSALNGPLDYLKKRRHCCQPKGPTDPRCMPIKVPEDDPYLKLTDIRCLNFTRAQTFQDVGCTEIPQEQINFQTTILDLSTIYGVDNEALARVREGEHGLLKMEKRGSRYLPLRNAAQYDCFQAKENDTCYNFGFLEIGNGDLRRTTFGIFFMREHNRLARALHEINPCWKDDRIFKVARQINIATAANMFMYELLPGILGYQNMINYGLISEEVAPVTVYDEEAMPLVYAEYEVATRYFNTLLDGRIKKYDEKYKYKGEVSLSDTLFKQNLLEQGNNFEEINRGTFFQHAAKMDDIQDAEISEHYFGAIEKAHDLSSIDIQRGRDMGLQGYNDYRKLCGLKSATKFEDFQDVMDSEKAEALKNIYNAIEDIDLLAGIMSENFLQNSLVGPTLFCIMAKQLQLFRFADRFWFERGDQLHSFSLAQLHEVRKTNMARFVCDNVEAIKSIQPQAMRNVGPRNMPHLCKHIPGPDLTRWYDSSCQKHKFKHRPSIPFKDSREFKQEPRMVMDYSSYFERPLSYN